MAKRIDYTVEELARKALKLSDRAWAPGLGEAEQIIAATLDTLGMEARPEPPRMPEGLRPPFVVRPGGDTVIQDASVWYVARALGGIPRADTAEVAAWTAHAMNEQARREGKLSQ